MDQQNTGHLKKYIDLLEYIGTFLPPNCEIVLHDTENVDKSIIAIKNNYISGRTIGGPITDFGLMLLKDKVYEKKDYILNYSSKTKDGKVLRSSTYFVKDDNNKLIAMLCVNIDLSVTKTLKNFLEGFISIYSDDKISSNTISPNIINDMADCSIQDNDVSSKNDTDVIEHFENSIDDIVGNIISQNLLRLNVSSPERLSVEERIEIVRALNESGIFLIKGAVAEVAKQLKVSENSVYRYISKLA